MLNKKITLIFDNQKFRVLDILMRIFQDSFLSSILFLFYNVKLLKICNSTKIRISNLAFINDINFFIYELITEKNCKQCEMKTACSVKMSRSERNSQCASKC